MRIEIDGALPRDMSLARRELKRAAEFFASRSGARVGEVFRYVAIIVQDDSASAAAHEAIMGVGGATDVITQRYEPMPGEELGVYGELYVNAEQAKRAAPCRKGWSAAKEFLLYVAHGMDHLSGADDLEEPDRMRMRRRELGWLKALDRCAKCE